MTAQQKIEPNLSGALVKALAEIEGAAKDKVNPHFKSKYADIASVIEAIKPVLAKHNLGFTQHSQPSEAGVIVETVLHHAGGETLSMGSLYVPANKNDAQGFGSALTYARRYALMTAFGVPAEDDDGNAAAKATAADGPIDDAQFATLIQMIEATKTDAQAFCAYLKVPSIKGIPQSKYDAAFAALKAKADKQKEPA